MKIHGNDEYLKVLGIENRFTSPTSGADGFGNILKHTLDSASAPEPLSTTSNCTQIKSLEPVFNDPIMQRLEGLLDLLEGYCQKLSNPRVNLKGLESTLQQLEQGRDALAPSVGALSENDGLKDILNRALITASLEIVRFKRGDYLPG